MNSPLQEEKRDSGGLFGWLLVTSVVSVLLIWFQLAFSVFSTAIVSGSMLPQIGIGDVVIVKKPSADAVKWRCDPVQVRKYKNCAPCRRMDRMKRAEEFYGPREMPIASRDADRFA